MSTNRKAFISGSFISLAPYSSPGCLPDLIARVDDCCKWLEDELKHPLQGRINDYKKLLSRYERIRGSYSDEMHNVLQSVAELATLVDTEYFLREQSSKEFRTTLKLSIDGKVYLSDTQDPSSDRSRNFLFELAVACQFARAGYGVDLTKPTDVIVNEPKLHIECKRVGSERKIRNLAKDALVQIQETCLPGESGVIYLDITEMAGIKHVPMVFDTSRFPHYLTPPHTEEELLDEIADYVDQHVVEFANEKAKSLLALLPKNVYLVLNFNYVGFQVSLVHERAMVGRRVYLYSPDGATGAVHDDVMAALRQASEGASGVGGM